MFTNDTTSAASLDSQAVRKLSILIDEISERSLSKIDEVASKISDYTQKETLQRAVASTRRDLKELLEQIKRGSVSAKQQIGEKIKAFAVGCWKGVCGLATKVSGSFAHAKLSTSDLAAGIYRLVKSALKSICTIFGRSAATVAKWCIDALQWVAKTVAVTVTVPALITVGVAERVSNRLDQYSYFPTQQVEQMSEHTDIAA